MVFIARISLTNPSIGCHGTMRNSWVCCDYILAIVGRLQNGRQKGVKILVGSDAPATEISRFSGTKPKITPILHGSDSQWVSKATSKCQIMIKCPIRSLRNVENGHIVSWTPLNIGKIPDHEKNCMSHPSVLQMIQKTSAAGQRCFVAITMACIDSIEAKWCAANTVLLRVPLWQ